MLLLNKCRIQPHLTISITPILVQATKASAWTIAVSSSLVSPHLPIFNTAGQMLLLIVPRLADLSRVSTCKVPILLQDLLLQTHLSQIIKPATSQLTQSKQYLTMVHKTSHDQPVHACAHTPIQMHAHTHTLIHIPQYFSNLTSFCSPSFLFYSYLYWPPDRVSNIQDLLPLHESFH